VTGQSATPHYQIDKAKRVVSLDCDFLGMEEDSYRLIRGHAKSRRLKDPKEIEQMTRDALAEGITSVKERHDEVHVIGSLNLVQSLLRLDLVDRLHLWLYPLLLGSGKHVFADGTVPTALRLTESVTYPNGTLQLAYETAGAPTYGNLAIEVNKSLSPSNDFVMVSGVF